MSEGACFEEGCGAVDCDHLRWVDDGFGSWFRQCSPGCDVQVVRPGKSQCNCGSDGRLIQVAEGPENSNDGTV